MNMLLIYAKFPETFWSFPLVPKLQLGNGLTEAGASAHLCSQAGAWEQEAKEVHPIKKKSAFPPLAFEDLAWVDHCFLGAMAIQRKSVAQIIACCKAMELKIVGGGPLFTAEPDTFSLTESIALNMDLQDRNREDFHEA